MEIFFLSHNSQLNMRASLIVVAAIAAVCLAAAPAKKAVELAPFFEGFVKSNQITVT